MFEVESCDQGSNGTKGKTQIDNKDHQLSDILGSHSESCEQSIHKRTNDKSHHGQLKELVYEYDNISSYDLMIHGEYHHRAQAYAILGRCARGRPGRSRAGVCMSILLVLSGRPHYVDDYFTVLG